MPIPTHDYSHKGVHAVALTVHLTGGRQFLLRGDEIIGTLMTIKTVGIRHLPDVVSHTVNAIVGSCSHVVHFVNGGHLQFAYNLAGDLIELSASNLGCSISKENDVLFFVPPPST